MALRADRAGTLRFAPLDGATFRQRVPEGERSLLPDSLVLLETNGSLLTRSEALAALLHRLGGPWRPLGSAVAALPRPLADRAYDAVARVRGVFFRRPPEPCPRVPPGLRTRFDP